MLVIITGYIMEHNYRLYDETEVYIAFSNTVGTWSIDVPSMQHKGIYSDFKGDLHPVYTEDWLGSTNFDNKIGPGGPNLTEQKWS